MHRIRLKLNAKVAKQPDLQVVPNTTMTGTESWRISQKVFGCDQLGIGKSFGRNQTGSVMGNALDHMGKAQEQAKPAEPDSPDWEQIVPYLPRIQSFKRRRRSNSLPIKPKPPMRILPLADVNSRRRSWRRSDYFYPEMIPEPDYSDSNDEEEGNEKATNESAEEGDLAVEEITAEEDTKTLPRRRINESPEPFGELRRNQTAPVGRVKPTIAKTPSLTKLSEEGLVVPKKPNNPYLQSEDRQKLCKELKFSQKYGKNGFNSKSELQRAMERFQEDKLRKSQAASKKSSLDRILEQQAKKIEMQEKETRPRRPDWVDRLQEEPDSWIKDSRTPEFFRVHARVMAHQSSGSSSESLVDEDARSKTSGSMKMSSKSGLSDDKDGKEDVEKKLSPTS